jgi:tRNA (guanine37-N1)-methyltransferase
LVDGVLAAPECYLDESISGGLLEYPQSTRPYEFHGQKVPDVLISGHHENIDKWRKERSLEITKERRPDLYKKYERR